MMRLNQSVPAVFAMMVGATLTGACNKSEPTAAQDNAATIPAAATAAATPTPVAAAAAAPADTSDPPDQTATASPPPPPAESPGPPPSPTTVWANGSYQFEQGKFVWMKGHWEPRHDGQFEQARWVQTNGRWEHHAARWIVGRPEAPRAVEVRPGEVRPGEVRPGERPGERVPERR
jgi:hypothetical protein